MSQATKDTETMNEYIKSSKTTVYKHICKNKSSTVKAENKIF